MDLHAKGTDCSLRRRTWSPRRLTGSSALGLARAPGAESLRQNAATT